MNEDMGIAPWVRAMLVCPKCGGTLVDRPHEAVSADDINGHLDCDTCTLAFPVVGGTPWLVVEHARRK